jgi:hypothetical protein
MDDWEKAALSVRAAKTRMCPPDASKPSKPRATAIPAPRRVTASRRGTLPPSANAAMAQVKDIALSKPAITVAGLVVAGVVVMKVKPVRAVALDVARIAIRVGVSRVIAKSMGS